MKSLRAWIRKRLELWAWSLVGDRVEAMAIEASGAMLNVAEAGARELVEAEHAYAKAVLNHAMARDAAIVNGSKIAGAIFPSLPPTLH